MRWTVIGLFVCAPLLWSCGGNPVSSNEDPQESGPMFNISLFDLRVMCDGESFAVYQEVSRAHTGRTTLWGLRIDPIFEP